MHNASVFGSRVLAQAHKAPPPLPRPVAAQAGLPAPNPMPEETKGEASRPSPGLLAVSTAPGVTSVHSAHSA